MSKRSEYDKQYRRNHRELINRMQQNWRDNNREFYNAYQRFWRYHQKMKKHEQG